MKLAFPVPKTSRVSFTYQQHVDYRIANNLASYNGGVDWAVNTGTQILAPAPGKVVRADGLDAAGYGNQVRIDHGGGYLTINGHLSEIKVKVNDLVTTGQLVGLSGYSGNCRPPGPNGAHLHFELRLNNNAIDPWPFLTNPADIKFKGTVLNSLGLAVRSGPGKSFSRIGPGLPVGTQVEVSKVSGDWAQLYPFDTWVCIREGTVTYLSLVEVGGTVVNNKGLLEQAVALVRQVADSL